MNIETLRQQASDLYFAIRSDSDPATMVEIQADYNRFSDKLANAVAAEVLRLGIAKGLLKMIDAPAYWS